MNFGTNFPFPRLSLSESLVPRADLGGGMHWGIEDLSGNVAIVISEWPVNGPPNLSIGGELDWRRRCTQLIDLPIIAGSIFTVPGDDFFTPKIMLNPIWKNVPNPLDLEAFSYASRGLAVAYHGEFNDAAIELAMIPSVFIKSEDLESYCRVTRSGIKALHRFEEIPRRYSMWREFSVDSIRRAYGPKILAMEKSIRDSTATS